MSKEKRTDQAGVNGAEYAEEAGGNVEKINEKANSGPQADSADETQDVSRKGGKEDIQDKKKEKEQEGSGKKSEDIGKELERVKADLEEKNRQCSDYLDRLQRTAAEFDNYKKRSAKEKEALYIDAVADVTGAFLPVLDNVERALKAIPSDDSSKSLKEGVTMVFKQLKEVFKNLGVEEIKAVGEQFDPMRHNAVMHIEDGEKGHNVIVEEFQKGYMYKDKVIRYSMVKVAN